MTESNIITIVGGSGFLGRYVVRELARAGYAIRVLCRHPQAAAHLKLSGDLGQILIEYADLSDMEAIQPKLAGAYAVINLVGVLFESGKQKFTTLHAQGAERLAQAALAQGVERFIQISALGVDQASGSHYARSKLLGEKAVLAAFSTATILRPSVIFGAEDNFFNQFARMACLSPFLPLIGGGNTRFQPVYVRDVANAIAACLKQESTKGQCYELGGPEIYRFRDILKLILRITERPAKLLRIPFSAASIMGAICELSPFTPLLTRDQVTSLKTDNVVQAGTKTFTDLGITPTSAELIVPAYLERFRKGGKHYGA